MLRKAEKGRGIDGDAVTSCKSGRPKKVINLENRYPRINPQKDNLDEQQKEQALASEMVKAHPRKDIILQLMKATFYARRQFILHNEGSVLSKLAKYPGLKMPIVVSA